MSWDIRKSGQDLDFEMEEPGGHEKADLGTKRNERAVHGSVTTL